MSSYLHRCRCGLIVKIVAEPLPCAGCDHCGSNLALGPDEHAPRAPHRWASAWRTDGSRFLRCACGATEVIGGIVVPARTPEGVCSTCRHPVYWITYPTTGKPHPVDCAPEACRAPTFADDGLGVSHFATCPDRDRHRRRRTEAVS